jgi:hypothetical protein
VTPAQRSTRSLNLTTGGLTLLGVLASIATTIAIGVDGRWWERVLIGVGTATMLVVLVKLGTSSGKGPVARLADWVIGFSEREDSSESTSEHRPDTRSCVDDNA